MVRIRHGETPATIETFHDALNAVRRINMDLGLASAPLRTTGLTPFGYMFPSLQTRGNWLIETDMTIGNLTRLGLAMSEKGDSPVNSAIPSAYTYFGQFIDHDITMEVKSDDLIKLSATFSPLEPSTITGQLQNRRSPTVDLDSVYGPTSDGDPVPRICDRLDVAGAVPVGSLPPNKDANNDLPRKPKSDNPRIDREALIGDVRNDENLVVAQMHVAFLRAHNAIVSLGYKFDDAKRILTEHYQWLIIHDFLKRRVADNETVNDLLTHGNRYYRPRDLCALYMPLEFSVAAYRFGHSMVRASYDYNLNETNASLKQLFDVTAFSGQLKGYRHIPQSWIIDWQRFLDGGTNRARRIDTLLVDPLKELQDTTGVVVKDIMANLAVRNLLRGYLLRIPTGQKVAEYLRIKVLSEEEIEKGVGAEQFAVLKSGNFLTQTPLWYYILAESQIKGNGALGPVGKTIVAETLIGLIRWTEKSILQQPGWKPFLGERPRTFMLKDFFQLAGVWK